jgi:RNA polymerase sigma factor (TIGR02999 family)
LLWSLRRLTGFFPSYFVASELWRLARRHLRGERAGHSLQAAALVNEAYMRLVDYKRMQWRDRAHFFAVSAQLMRRILVDHARRHNLKRGGGVQHVSLEQAAFVGGGQSEDLVALDEAIDELAGFDARKAQVGKGGLWFWSDARRFALVASGHMYTSQS